MKKSLFVLLALLMLLAACAPAAAVPAEEATTAPVAAETAAPAAENSTLPIVITDALDHQVTLDTVPQRIVIVGKALFIIGDAAFMFPEAFNRVAAMGNTGQGSGNFLQMIIPDYDALASIDMEAGAEEIAASNPDLVIMKTSSAGSLGTSLEALNIPVIYVDFETPDAYMRDIAILGQIFQDPERAAEISTYFDDQISAVETAVAGTEQPSTLLLYYNERDGAISFNVAPETWMQTLMVQMAGGSPVWTSANLGDGWTEITLEQVAAWDPDYIFIVAYFNDPSEVVASLEADPNWQLLRSLQEGHLYVFPGDAYSWDEPNPRWILGLKWVANILHPDRFPGFDIIQESETFYSTLYGLDSDFYATNIQPTLHGDWQ